MRPYPSHLSAWAPRGALLIALGVSLGLPTPAAGHPFGASTAAHRTELVLTPEQVEIQYRVAVPEAVIRANARLRPGRDPVATTSAELVSGLMVLADGERIELKVQGSASVERDEDAFVIGLRFTGALPPGFQQIEVSNGNLPEVSTVASHIIRVHPSLVVRDSSLLQLRRGRLTRDESGRWLPGEQGRRAQVELEHRNHLMHRAARWLAHAPSEPIQLAQALPIGPGASLRTGPPTTGVVWGFLGLAVLLAASQPLKSRRWALPLVALPAALFGAMSPAWLWPGLDLGLAALALGVAWLRPSAPWVGLIALAAGAHAWRLGGAVVGIALLVAGLRYAGASRSKPEESSLNPLSARVALLLVGVCLAVRGGLAMWGGAR